MTNWNEVQLHWADYRKKVLSNWNQLTPEQVDIMAGSRPALLASIQESYECDTKEAERQVNNWLNNLLGTQSNNELLTENLKDQLQQNQNTSETIEERDAIVGSPYHKGY